MIQSKDDLRYYLSEDRKALGIKDKLSIQDIVMPNKIWKFEKILRHFEYYKNVPSFWNKLMFIITGIRFRKISVKLGFSIPANVFGPGLSIAHYGTIVVNSNTRVGSNCRIHASVNIGTSGGGKIAPKIGDNVYIGPGAILFGDIQIANNVTIGANATVNKSFDVENCVLAGTPAKIVKYNSLNWLEFNQIKQSQNH